jgi:D-3-phosphoglycerate dehydrogenase
MAHKVLVSTRFFDPATETFLRDNGCDVVRTGLPDDVQDDTLDAATLARLLDGAEGWIVGMVPVTRDLLRAHPALRVIARRGVGYNNVDVEAARDLGRTVTIAPGGNEASVADHALGMMLAVAKRLREGHLAMQNGRWTPLVTSELFEKTVGLVGFGRIARAVARRLRGFDARILAYDPAPDHAAAAAAGVEFVDLATLLAHSDYVSLHLPLTPATRHLINATTIAQAKPGAVVINTSRGGLIDEKALLAALTAGHLGGAGLDVFEEEANPAGWPEILKLLALPNVIGSAHAAGSSHEGLARTNRIAAQTVVDVLNGRRPVEQCVVAG